VMSTAFARNRKIPIERASIGVGKEDYLRLALRRMEGRNRFGGYFTLKSLGLGLPV
jgi:hypothetical protein